MIIDSASTVAVVPIRSLRGGKTRLAPVLAPEARAQLIAALLRRTLGVLTALPEIDQVIVVTPDNAVVDELARHAPAVCVLRQSPERPGLIDGLDLARSVVLPDPPGRFLVVFGDLPLLDEHDVLALLETEADVGLAPDARGIGTNALVLRGGAGNRVIDAFPFRFGEESAARHQAAARELGLHAEWLIRPGLALDLDEPADWFALDEQQRDALVPGHDGVRAAISSRHLDDEG